MPYLSLFLCVPLTISCQPGKIANSDNISDKDTQEDTPDNTLPPEPLTDGFMFEHNGLERHFLLHIPDGLDPSPPLVIVMHGYGGTAQEMQNGSGMNQQANTDGFVVVYPQGTKDQWDQHFFNVGYEFHSGQNVDDLSFIIDLVAYLQESYALSPTDVFSTGMSNGGDMSYLLACEGSDTIKAIAPVAGTMMKYIIDDCTPNRQIPVFEIHGTEDDITYWDGDYNNVDGWGAYADIPSIIDFWVSHNGLTELDTTDLEDSQANDNSNIVFHRHWTEGSTTEVWLYRIENGGHDWPGWWGNQDIQTSEALWTFFEKYTE